jgi:hypothetical protein
MKLMAKKGIMQLALRKGSKMKNPNFLAIIFKRFIQFETIVFQCNQANIMYSSILKDMAKT